MRIRIEILNWNKYQPKESIKSERVRWFKMPNNFFHHAVWEELSLGGIKLWFGLLQYMSTHYHQTGVLIADDVSLLSILGCSRIPLRSNLDALASSGFLTYQILADKNPDIDPNRLDQNRIESLVLPSQKDPTPTEVRAELSSFSKGFGFGKKPARMKDREKSIAYLRAIESKEKGL